MGDTAELNCIRKDDDSRMHLLKGFIAVQIDEMSI